MAQDCKQAIICAPLHRQIISFIFEDIVCDHWRPSMYELYEVYEHIAHNSIYKYNCIGVYMLIMLDTLKSKKSIDNIMSAKATTYPFSCNDLCL